jgi:hypothetical protein
VISAEGGHAGGSGGAAKHSIIRAHQLVALACSMVARGEPATCTGSPGGDPSTTAVVELSCDHGARAAGLAWHGEGGDSNR